MLKCFKFRFIKQTFIVAFLCVLSGLLFKLRVTTSELAKVKSILIWNSRLRLESGAEFGSGSNAFIRNGCQFTRCQLYFNSFDLPFEQFDAVLLNMLELDERRKPEDEGFNRSSHQRFVFLNQESPMTMTWYSEFLRNYFNWTMSYRLDSDILLIYGKVRPKASAPRTTDQVQRFIERTHQWTKHWPNKTKSVAWMVGHCKTDGLRETYVQELRKYIDVDIYGGCGALKCHRNEMYWMSDPECYDLLASQYKFYLSFENSLCRDYATEKFFEILAHDLVPVVYGGANYSALAPPHSYIDALQFTPSQLARHLRRIGSNETLYNEFFWWKEHYTVDAGLEQMVRNGFCDLCRKLHEDSSVKVYDDVDNFWSESHCVHVKAWDHAKPNSSNETKRISFWK